jgi:hypothetical protein
VRDRQRVAGSVRGRANAEGAVRGMEGPCLAYVRAQTAMGGRARALLMCVPRPRWMPEHSMHSTMPRLMLAQSGFGAPQSTHVRFAACPISGTRVRGVTDWGVRLRPEPPPVKLPSPVP